MCALDRGLESADGALCHVRHETGVFVLYVVLRQVEGNGTAMVLRGYGIVPTGDEIVIRLRDVDVTDDGAGNPLSVTVDGNGTYIAFNAPELDATEGKLVTIEVALNGVDFTSSGVAVT